MSLKRTTPATIPLRGRAAVDAETLRIAGEIVESVRIEGEAALRHHAERFGDVPTGGALIYDRAAMQEALESLPAEDRAVLERVAERVRSFAEAQKASLKPLTLDIPGGKAGHTLAPVQRAGCYAPAGRFPLPSSVLMTAVTARVAGVESVWVASPKPTPITLGAAAVAGADAFLAVGGAQAIAALAYGAGEVPTCDAIVGPGNRWVTAAKQLVSGQVAIDMLAGPSELVVLADGAADAGLVAADLLAQAEHDVDALPILVTPSEDLADAVNAALTEQLATLPTAETARAAVAAGFCVLVRDLDEGIEVCDTLAPEHLEILTADPEPIARRCQHYGGLFIGAGAAEVLGDYGAGPNHVLPTGATARYTGGLSVLTFLRVRTWMQMDDPRTLARDAAHLARLEGLEAHARAADRRAD